MTGALVTVGVNSLAFYLISEVVPGFDVKNKKTLLAMAVLYSFMAGVAMVFALPISLFFAFIFAILSFIPVIGPTLAGAGMLITTFILTFAVSFGLLLTIDKFMEEFKMRNRSVALVASVLLAVIGVVARLVIGI